jgi:hypothetical protein
MQSTNIKQLRFDYLKRNQTKVLSKGNLIVFLAAFSLDYKNMMLYNQALITSLLLKKGNNILIEYL